LAWTKKRTVGMRGA